VACGDDGIASFDRIRYRRHDAGVFLYAFDLLELDGDDLRRDPLAVRKATLASLLRRARRRVHYIPSYCPHLGRPPKVTAGA
jgi:bifunctional non-homologous end joining protein LigD